MILQFVPPWRTVWVGGPILLGWSIACLSAAACLKVRCAVAAGYSRKTFHLLTFATASALQWTAGVALVSLFGAMTTLVLAYAIVRGEGHPFYEALAREQDAPHRTHYIVVSYVATLLGGLLSNVAAGPFAVCGYLICGLGDAAGEPIGARWGRRWYPVPARRSVRCRRSIEGSIGVFVVSTISLAVLLIANGGVRELGRCSAAILAIGLTSTIVEGLSPHGWDNATLQVIPSVMAARMLAP